MREMFKVRVVSCMSDCKVCDNEDTTILLLWTMENSRALRHILAYNAMMHTQSIQRCLYRQTDSFQIIKSYMIVYLAENTEMESFGEP